MAASCAATAERGGLVAAAKERVNFTVPAKSGASGQVLTFETEGELDSTVRAFEAVSALAGRHRYASRSARVFVQLSAETPEATGAAARTLVDAL